MFKVNRLLIARLLYAGLLLPVLVRPGSAAANLTNFTFEFKGKAAFYYRASDLVEQTGNEDTFGAAFTPAFQLNWQKPGFGLTFNAHFTLLEQLSAQARIYEQMNPPSVLWENLALNIALGKYFALNCGLAAPLTRHYPLRPSVYPVMYGSGILPTNYFHTNTNSPPADSNSIAVNAYGTYQAFYKGFRDTPLPYSGLIDEYDTGLGITLKFFPLLLRLALVNGEQGLDANSAKTVALDIGITNRHIQSGLALQIGNEGSVPVKVTKHIYKSYFFFRKKKFLLGLEGFLFLYGLRRPGASYAKYEYYLERYGYRDGFWSLFMLAHPDNFKEDGFIFDNTYGGLSAYLLLAVNKIWKERFSFVAHYSFFDPHIKNNKESSFKTKHRFYAGISFHFFPWLKLLISDTYTYDPVFLNYHQYYERESRSHHYQLDNDLYAGLLFIFSL